MLAFKMVGAFVLAACLGLLGAPAAQASRPTSSSPTPACQILSGYAAGRGDAAPPLIACLASVSPGSDVALSPGRYILRSRVVIQQPVRLHTADIGANTKGCRPKADSRCATLVLVPNLSRRGLPFAVLASGTRIDALIFEGGKTMDPSATQNACGSSDRKSSGGGLQVQGDNIVITRSVLEGFACYTALEYEGGRNTKIINNIFINNGTHDKSWSWSDGLTVHDGRNLEIANNLFIDNTDVQLIFGGCQQCTIRQNRFRHTGASAGGSFAELMLHAWPNGATSGDFTGSIVAANDIDCSSNKRCGFGLMIGPSPWYQGPTFGGTVKDNRIANAMIGLNVNDLTGIMQIQGNHILSSGGQFMSTCGPRSTPAINISPASRHYVDPMAVSDEHSDSVGNDSFAGCLLNHPLAHTAGGTH